MRRRSKGTACAADSQKPDSIGDSAVGRSDPTVLVLIFRLFLCGYRYPMTNYLLSFYQSHNDTRLEYTTSQMCSTHYEEYLSN
mmetsp:Transcript_7798/g.18005  ORF Transcript_7798/g.18005 Transcript_7798/m.18005 type:complete len:83 (+) Transcript_7798:716-964(+)